MADLATIIAKAIRDADKSWFNEDYTKQATAVLNALRSKGYEICPVEAPDALVTHAVDNMPFGRMKPDDLIRELYKVLIDGARRFR
jgi:hypothetical protein